MDQEKITILSKSKPSKKAFFRLNSLLGRNDQNYENANADISITNTKRSLNSTQ